MYVLTYADHGGEATTANNVVFTSEEYSKDISFSVFASSPHHAADARTRTLSVFLGLFYSQLAFRE